MSISKTDFIRGLQCEKMLWLDAHKPEEKIIPSGIPVKDIFFSKVNMCVHLGRIENILQEDPMTTLIKVKDISKSDELSKIVEQYDGLKLRFWSGRWTEISEIYFEKINKGDALRKIANYYNIPAERIISFGDANNDIELIQVGKYGFAMKNGEVELKQYASKITEFTNDEDGVIKEIQKIIK
jgi:hydroxymethylpyrimidine pyrophosphatase-like HAD family hydrolase